MYIYYTIIGTLLSWLAMTYVLHNGTDSIKITRNYISALHATFVLLFFTFSVPSSCLFYVTFGYYMFDGIMELYYLVKTRRFYNLTIVLHHIIACFISYYLRDEVVSKYLYYSFFLTEISNFPIYLVYHLKLKGYNDNFVIKSLICVEALSFFVLRLVLCGINLHKSIISNEVPYPPILCGCLIYIMSTIWLYGMILQIFRKSDDKKEKKD